MIVIMFWLFMLKNRINFSQDNSITNEIMSKKMKVQQTEDLRHIGFYGSVSSHFECCWIALGAKPHVDGDITLKFLYGYAIFISCLCLGRLFSPCPNLIVKVALAFLSHNYYGPQCLQAQLASISTNLL